MLAETDACTAVTSDEAGSTPGRRQAGGPTCSTHTVSGVQGENQRLARAFHCDNDGRAGTADATCAFMNTEVPSADIGWRNDTRFRVLCVVCQARLGQFSVGRSMRSITSTSTGERRGSSFKPVCSWRAVNSVGRSSETASTGSGDTPLSGTYFSLS
jgi:hypothetical protein